MKQKKLFKKNKFKEFITKNEIETNNISNFILSLNLDKNNLILFYGDLSSGKTTIIKSIFKNMNLEEEIINSPSFNIKNSYQWNNKIISHYDFYFQQDFNEEFIASLNEDLNDGIVFVEWAEKFSKLSKYKNKIEIKIFIIDENKRRIRIEY